MPPLTPEMAQYLLEQNIQRWSDNLNVQQKAFEMMARQAQQGVPLAQELEAIQGGELGQHLVHTRGTIQAMQNYLTQARGVLAQGGQTMMNFVGRMGNAGVVIGEEAAAFYSQHSTEANTLATATGGKIVQYTVQTAATAGAEGVAVAETAAAAGAIGETTVAAGAIAETTVAAGAIAETTVAAGGVVVAEAGAGSTIAAGATGGSWLGPPGIIAGIVIAVVIAGGIYVYTRDDKPTVAISTISSDSDTDFSTSDSDSETTTTEAETTTTTSPPPARSLDGSYRVTSTVVGGGTEDLTCTGREATLEVHARATTFDFSNVGTAPRGPGDTFTLTLPASSPDGSPATETIKGDFDPSADPPTLSGTATLVFEGGVKCDFTIAGARLD